jgi:hypothetical protein
MSRITNWTTPFLIAAALCSCSKEPPASGKWDLVLENANLCLPAGSVVPLQAFVRTGSHTDNFHNTYPEGYTSRDPQAAGKFSWRVLPTTDPFWTTRLRPVTWFASATIDNQHNLVGAGEGVIAVEVRYVGKGDTTVFTVIPAIHVEIEPTEPHVKVHDWTTFTIRAAFADGRPVPAVPPPQLDPVGNENALMMAGNPNSRGEQFAPWYAYVNAVASGRYKLKFRYLGDERDLSVVAEGVGESKPNPKEIEDARRGAFPNNNAPITDPILARRVAAMANHCVYSDDNIPAGDVPESP